MADPLLVEVGLGAGDWANISDRISDRSAITITRGAGDEDSTPNPSTASLAFDNRDGLFNVRNPASPLYGMLGRNAPLRISYGRGKFGAVLGQPDATETTGRITSFDSVQLSPTGDLDIRVDMEILENSSRTWTGGSFDILSKFNDTNADRSYSFLITSGKLRFSWSPDGTLAAVRSANASVFLTGAATGRRVMRVTLDVNNGAGGVDVKFWSGSSMAGPWTQIGTTQTSAGVTSVFNGGAWTRIGSGRETSSQTWGKAPHCVIYAAQIYSGTTLIASPTFTAQPLDPVPFAASSFNDAQGNNWFYEGGADASRIWYGDVDIRFVGEIASLPNRFSTGLHDRWVPITANGILRRLGQGKATTASGLRDFVLKNSSALATYFPLDGKEGTLYSLNIGPTYYLGTKFYGEHGPVYKYGVNLGGSVGSVMEINATGDTSNLRGDVGTGLQNAAFDFVFQSSAFGVLTYDVQDYNVSRMRVVLNDSSNGATAQVYFIDNAGNTSTFSPTGVLPELRDNAIHHCRLTISTSGGNINWAFYLDGTLRDTGTQGGFIWNGTSLFRMYYTRYVNQSYVNVGHLTLWAHSNAASIPSAEDAAAAAFGYAGDTAADRVTRVAADGNIPVKIVGTPSESQAVGVLYSEPRLNQIRDAAAADLGVLHEARDSASLLFRTRASMTGQSPALTLSFADKQIADPLEPVDDDQRTRNDVTASRRDGGSYRVVVSSGRLSTQDPPFGAGLYADEVTVNVQTDAMLANVAAWLTANGTLDKARYPSVSVNLASPQITQAVIDGAHAVDVGDLLRMTGAAAIGEYDDVDLIVVGYTETIGQVNRSGVRHGSFTYICAPADVYQIARYGTARYDTGGTTLASAASSTATSLSLATAAGHALWTTAPAAFPLDLWVAGERVTVTAISGTSSPQTATVVRSVNGVVKGQAAGATVRLFDTPRYAL